MSALTAPPMAYYGGKTRLATRIAALLPPHRHYVEPFAGSLAVLLAKAPSRMETVNDLDGLLITFWRVLREQPDALARVCALTPHSRAEYLQARDANIDDLDGLDDIEVARLVWIRITQARAHTTRPSGTGWKYHIDPAGSGTSMPGYLNAYVERMAAAARRLHHVSLECRPANEIVRAYGAFAGACLYVDPPYLGSARTDGGNGYRIDMRSADDHNQLLDALLACRAAVLVSGYASDLYDTALHGWSRIEIATGTAQGGKYQARTEVLWSNRPIGDQPALFDIEEAV